MRWLSNLFRTSRAAEVTGTRLANLHARARSLSAAGDLEGARACYATALELAPSNTDSAFNLATLLLLQDRHGEAEHALRGLTERGIRAPDVLCNLGIALGAQGRHAEAEPLLREALIQSPSSTPLVAQLGVCLNHQGRWREAADVLDNALKRAPSDRALVTHLAQLYYDHGDFDRAQSLWQQNLLHNPDDPEPRERLGCITLLRGHISEGWAGYRLIMREALVRQNPGISIDSRLPPDLAGRTLLLLGEQGIGDELFFLRYVPLLQQRGARIIYRAESRIADVLAARPLGFDSIHRVGKPLPSHDHAMLIGDLPRAFPNTFPAPLKLSPLPARLARAREQLAALGPRPYIAFGWRAGVGPGIAGLPTPLAKQVPPELLAATLRRIPGTLISLQRDPAAAELAALPGLIGRPVHDLGASSADLEQMLALLAGIDDYVSVSNTNMHLLASLGRTAKVLVPCPPDWRWMAAGASSPWFPGFRVYRQNGDGPWSDALAELERDLHAQSYATKEK